MNVDPSNYHQFLAKRKLWSECLSGDDPNSIVNQLRSLSSSTAIFKVIGESWRLAEKDNDGSPKRNYPLFRLINEGFMHLAVTAIRRQNDQHPLEGKNGVNSLRKLLEDMIEHRPLLTRQNYFLAEELVYDVGHLRRQREMQCMRIEGGASKLQAIPSERSSEMRHRQMDALCRVSAENRKPNDTVSEDILAFLRDRVTSACDKFEKFANSYLAHSATPESRIQKGTAEIRCTYQDLFAAQRVLRETAAFVAAYLLTRTHHTLMPYPQYDPLKYLDVPIMTDETRSAFQSILDQHEKEIRESENWSIDDLELK